MTAPDPRRFLYRSLDPDAAKRLASSHLSPHDDGELYLQYSTTESFGFDDGRLKTADYHTSSGFGLRGVSGETTAFDVQAPGGRSPFETSARPGTVSGGHRGIRLLLLI